jgi:hypothetical protein
MVQLMKRSTSPCTCRAYAFPHRPHSGSCFDAGAGPYCGDCNEPCGTTSVDYGIGAYEYGSIRAVHRDVRTVSSCCEAPVFHDASLTDPY